MAPQATVSVSSSSAADSPAFFNADYVVPALVLAFVALNVGNDEKYAALRGALAALLRRPRQILPEALGLAIVSLTVTAGLLLSPSGLRASSVELEALRAEDEYTFGLRRLWPTLLHADSLLVVQQLLMALGASLLLLRGACAQGSSPLTLALALLAVAQGLRTHQWMEGQNYTPEGPIGGLFAGVCACVCLSTMIAASLRSMRSACASGCNAVGAVRGAVNFILILVLCAWAAAENYIAASDSKRPDLMFAFIYIVEMCAAPLLLAAACGAAEEVASLGGALLSLTLAQAIGMWWFLDFAGLLQDPNSEDSLVQHDLKIKNMLKSFQHGHAFALFAASHGVRALCAAGSCGAYAVLRLSKPDTSPKEGASASLRVEPFVV